MAAPSGFSFASVSGTNCTSGNPSTATILADQTTTCTFTNLRHTGTLTVKQDLDTDGDGQVDLFNVGTWTWDIQAGEQNIATSQSRTLPTGSYTIAEDPQAGFRVTNLTCDGQNLGAIAQATVQLDQNENVVCTFVNQQEQSAIGLDKTGPATASAGSQIT